MKLPKWSLSTTHRSTCAGLKEFQIGNCQTSGAGHQPELAPTDSVEVGWLHHISTNPAGFSQSKKIQEIKCICGICVRFDCLSTRIEALVDPVKADAIWTGSLQYVRYTDSILKHNGGALACLISARLRWPKWPSWAESFKSFDHGVHFVAESVTALIAPCNNSSMCQNSCERRICGLNSAYISELSVNFRAITTFAWIAPGNDWSISQDCSEGAMWTLNTLHTF